MQFGAANTNATHNFYDHLTTFTDLAEVVRTASELKLLLTLQVFCVDALYSKDCNDRAVQDFLRSGSRRHVWEGHALHVNVRARLSVDRQCVCIQRAHGVHVTQPAPSHIFIPPQS